MDSSSSSGGESSSRSTGGKKPLVSPKRELYFEIGPSTFDDEKKKRCRSASRRLVEIYTGMKCKASKCDQRFSAYKFPRMGICGHYFCASHGEDNVFKCKECYSTDNTNFIQDIVLDDFYKAIADPGFQCNKCGEFHPTQNVVACSQTREVYCVWCAVVFYINKKRFQSVDDDPTTAPGQLLHSVDRTQNSAGWALNTCCFCWESLCNPHKEVRTEIVHLFSCNHIGHKKCLNGKKGEDNLIKCQLCVGESAVTERTERITERTAYTKYYLDELFHVNQQWEFSDADYRKCETCSQLHPPSNLSRMLLQKDTCVWCLLVRKDDERVTAVATGQNKKKDQNKPKSPGFFGQLFGQKTKN